MKSQVWLLEKVLLDCGTRCNVETGRDFLTITTRVEKEGFSFVTISLPSFCKGFERALDIGRISSDLVPHFRCRAGMPLFLGGFLEKIFHKDGTLRDDPCIESIASIRQICLLYKKIEMECTKKRQQKAEDAFIACENGIVGMKPDDLKEKFKRVSAIVVNSCLSDDFYDELIPCHGPGATQERILGNSKFVFKRWHTRLERVLPFSEFAMGTLRNFGEEDCPLARVEFIEPRDEAPVRVVFVPKTLKAPRVIAIEPACVQFAQQALLGWMVPRIQQGPITGGHVNFSDQSINQRLARQASEDGRFATVDLSEASDRVSASLVRDMLAVVPVFRDYVFACRSSRATLPSGKTVTLRKFASMGSATCFPMEAMAFFCAIVAIRLCEAKCAVTRANVSKYSREVFVYGDDLIVPTDEAFTICSKLPAFGLKVNSHKSFWTGKFRESCGVDAYDGIDVTPVYCRRIPPRNRHSVEEVASWVAMGNQFYEKGYYNATSVVKEIVELALRFRLPTLKRISQGLGWLFVSENTPIERGNKTLFRREVKTYVLSPVASTDVLVGDGALLKCLTMIGRTTIHGFRGFVAPIPFSSEYRTPLWDIWGLEAPDAKHLLQSVRRGALALKLRWVPV